MTRKILKCYHSLFRNADNLMSDSEKRILSNIDFDKDPNEVSSKFNQQKDTIKSKSKTKTEKSLDKIKQPGALAENTPQANSILKLVSMKKEDLAVG